MGYAAIPIYTHGSFLSEFKAPHGAMETSHLRVPLIFRQSRLATSPVLLGPDEKNQTFPPWQHIHGNTSILIFVRQSRLATSPVLLGPDEKNQTFPPWQHIHGTMSRTRVHLTSWWQPMGFGPLCGKAVLQDPWDLLGPLGIPISQLLTKTG